MSRPRLRVFVCRGVTCSTLFADDVFREFRRQLRRHAPDVELERGGCYSRCGGGVTVMVRVGDDERQLPVCYPEVLEPEVRRIVVEHLREGCPITELQRAHRGAKTPL